MRVLAITILVSLLIASPSRASDSFSRFQNAYALLVQKGYITAESQAGDGSDRASSMAQTSEASSAQAEKLLNRALDAFDFSAAQAISLLHKNGYPLAAAAREEEPTKASATNDGPQARVNRIIEELYGAKGAGYVNENRASQNPHLDRNVAEVYRVTETSPSTDGWYSVVLEIGTLDEKSTTIPLMVNIETGQAYENYGVEGQQATVRQAQAF